MKAIAIAHDHFSSSYLCDECGGCLKLWIGIPGGAEEAKMQWPGSCCVLEKVKHLLFFSSTS
jgi:hypothetical protein